MIGLCLEGNRVNERLGNSRDDINDSRRQIGRLTLLPRDPKTVSGHILTTEINGTSQDVCYHFVVIVNRSDCY